MASRSSSARGSARIEGWRYERWTGSCPHERRRSQRLASDFVVVWSCGFQSDGDRPAAREMIVARLALSPSSPRTAGGATLRALGLLRALSALAHR
jgi:hypothetical protein